MRIELPYKFPNEADKIYREAEAFRQRSSTDRLDTIFGLMACGWQMMADSPHGKDGLALREAEEAEWRRIQTELFLRHGN